MLKPAQWLLLAVLSLASLAACGGGGEIGDPCDEEVASGECVDGATCGKTKSGVLRCMRLCTMQTECPVNTECTGSKSSLKVCQPNQT